jgi:hypothetical protein
MLCNQSGRGIHTATGWIRHDNADGFGWPFLRETGEREQTHKAKKEESANRGNLHGEVTSTKKLWCHAITPPKGGKA